MNRGLTRVTTGVIIGDASRLAAAYGGALSIETPQRVGSAVAGHLADPKRFVPQGRSGCVTDWGR